MEHALTEFNNSFSVTIKEQPGNKGCWLGVCVYDVVKNLGYKGCFGIGKGTWGIDQVGASHQSVYSWSHHDTAFNSQPKVVHLTLFLGFYFCSWRYSEDKRRFQEQYGCI